MLTGFEAAFPPFPLIYPESCNKIAEEQYVDGILCKQKKEFHAAFLLFSTAAIKGHKEAEFELALCYQNGHGASQDLQAALYWFESSAAHGHTPSAYCSAVYYKFGYGVEKNIAESARWAEHISREEMEIIELLVDFSAIKDLSDHFSSDGEGGPIFDELPGF